MKYSRNRQIFWGLTLLLIFLGVLSCTNKNKSQNLSDSKLILLRTGNEKTVFASRPDTNKLIFLPLVVSDDISEPHPSLLERWEHNENYTEWTFFLRKGITWSDGEPVTSRDVKFTLELYTDPKMAYETKVFDDITIVDDYQCSLHASKRFTALLYRAFGILPSHLLKDLDIADYHSWDFWNKPIGDGPYRYVRHLPDVMVELEANPDYYGPPPKIKQIVIKFGGNALTELLSGNVDAVNGFPQIEISQVIKTNRFNIYHEFNVIGVTSILWNHTNPLFQNPTVRRALTQSINRRELSQILNLPEDTPIYDSAITPSQLSRGEVPDPFPYDLDKASKLLDEAGWRQRETGGIREKNGQKFQFSLMFSPEYTSSAVYIQDQFRKIGVDMEASTLELSVCMARMEDNDFDAWMQSFPSLSSGWGYGGYDNPEFNRLQQKIYDIVSMEELENVVKKLQPIFLSDIPWTFLYPNVTFNVVHKRVKGLKSPFLADPVKAIEKIWIENPQ